jgi:ABC-type cobalamin/Fe3+-siderophores transport system ATPase subunit
MTDNIVRLDKQIDQADLDHVTFAQTIENPSVEQVQSILDDKKHLLIVGAGGCGKTWLLKKL